MKKKQHFVPITRRNLFQRINRALKKKGRNLRTHPGKTGAVFIVDVKRSRVVSVNQDLEQLGVQVGVLENFEEVAQRDAEAQGRATKRANDRRTR